MNNRRSRSRLIGVSCVAILVVGGSSLWSRPHATKDSTRQLLQSAQVNSKILAVISRSCRDCHSEQTNYPWYSYIAPVSWLVEYDVKKGRERLNFSTWSEYSVLRRERCLSEIANQVADGDMPLRSYALIHRSAKLSHEDAEVLFEWTQSEKTRLIAASRGPVSRQSEGPRAQ